MGDPGFLSILHFEGPVLPARVADARERARGLLVEARREAEAIRGAAEAEVEARCEAALAEQRGAQARWLSRRRERLARADHLRRVRLCEAAVEACLAVAEQVWRQVPEERGPILRALAREMHRRAPVGQSLEFRVHPSDLGSLEDPTAARSDAALEPGDLLGTFEGGGLDGRAPARAGQALDALAASLGRLRETGP